MNSNQKLQLNSTNGGIAFAVMMAVYVIVSFVGQAIFGAIFGTTSSKYIAVCSTFSVISLLGVVLFYVFYGKNKFKYTVKLERSGGVYIALAFLLSVGMFAGVGFINGSFAKALEKAGLSVSGINLKMPTIWHFIVFTLTFAIFPAIVEEFFFRGLLLNSLSGLKTVFAVLTSALCFALYHCSLVQFIYQFIYGILLGYMAIICKSTVPCMISHFLNNFAVILFTYLGVNVNLLDPVVLVIGINALALTCTAIFFGAKKMEKAQENKGEIKKFFLPYGIFGFIVCITLLVGNLFV